MDDNVGLNIEIDDTAKDEDELFYFESDHLALKGNKDYSELLKTIVILESIREKSLKDYEDVVKLHKQAIENPFSIIDKLTNNESLGIPDWYEIPMVPVIDWKKFDIPIPEQSIKELSEDTKITAAKPNNNEFNPKSKHWTTDEQKRLEELLYIHPPEAVELNRFKKIANALGNRTVKQVCSRVQKYFLKLHKAGLPIPGRIPKNIYDKKKTHKHHKHNHFLYKPSTFFPELDIPVVMKEEEDAPGPSQSSSQNSNEFLNNSEQNYLLSNSYLENSANLDNKSEKEIQLRILRKVKSEKIKMNANPNTLFQHIGFSCDYCNEDPILGSRWHCIKCVNTSIDFCNDCMISQLFSNNPHPIKHKLIVIRNEKIQSTSISSNSEDSDSFSD